VKGEVSCRLEWLGEGLGEVSFAVA
jgi:hypothetical protein